MGQTVDIAYKSAVNSKAVNEKIMDIMGINGVFKGFSVVPGTGRTVNITNGADSESMLFINGARIKETTSINSIAIAANTSGTKRTDTLYAYYEHTVSVSCSYAVAQGSTQVPAGGLACKIAEIDVQNNATTISANDIRLVKKIYTLKAMSDLLDDVKSKIETEIADYNTYSSSKDSETKVFTVVDFKRKDGTLYSKSTLSNKNATTKNYQTVTQQYYDTDGTTLILTKVWTLTYDGDNDITSKVVS